MHLWSIKLHGFCQILPVRNKKGRWSCDTPTVNWISELWCLQTVWLHGLVFTWSTAHIGREKYICFRNYLTLYTVEPASLAAAASERIQDYGRPLLVTLFRQNFLLLSRIFCKLWSYLNGCLRPNGKSYEHPPISIYLIFHTWTTPAMYFTHSYSPAIITHI